MSQQQPPAPPTQALILSDSPTTATAAAAASPDADLRPELRPIAERHGRELLDFAIRLAGANTALDWCLTYSLTHSKLRPQVALLMDSQAYICNKLVEAKGWNWDQLIECIADVGRAAKLAGPGGHA